MKSFIISSIVTFLAFLGFGYLWHSFIITNFFADLATDIIRPDHLMSFLIGGIALKSFLFTYIYKMGYKDTSPIWEGLRFGFVFGLLLIAQATLISYGVYNITNWTWILVSATGLMLSSLTAGICMGTVLGADSGE